MSPSVYRGCVAVLLLLAMVAVSCSTSEMETANLGETLEVTPTTVATRVPRAVVTLPPRSTLAPLASPSASPSITPLATTTPDGTATPTRPTTVTATPSPVPTSTGTPVGTSTPSSTVSPTPRATLLPTATVTGTPLPSRAVQSAASTLQQKTRAFREAVEGKDTNSMLRLQRELLDEASKAEASIKDERSEFAEHLRSAIRAIREGAAGEMGKLDAALRDLKEASGSQQDEDDRRDQGTRTPAFSPSELRSMADSLSKKIDSFEEARRSRNAESLLRQQKELLEEMSRIEQSVKSDHTRPGEQLRSALESIRNGLAGDENKLDEARRALRKALED